MDAYFNQGLVHFFQARSAQKFSIKVWLKFSGQGLTDRYAASRQGVGYRLKFSGQGLIIISRPTTHASPLKPGGWPVSA
jgi:hypothetical protein